MGIFDFLSSNAAPQAAQPAASPPQAAPTPDPKYADFYSNLIAAAQAKPHDYANSVFDLWDGTAQKRAATAAASAAPQLWAAFKQAQAASQGAQLNNASNIAATGAMANNTPIDPNNIAAAIPALQSAYAGGMSGAPGATGTNADGSPVTDLQRQRAFLGNMIRMFSHNPTMAPLMKDIEAMRDKGIPEGTTVLPNGQLADAVSGKPVSGGVGAVLAANATPTEVMKTNEANRHSAYQGGIDVSVHAKNAAKDASLDLVDGLDDKTGLPVTRTRADVVANGGMVKSNPYFAGQQAETKDLRTKAESAEQGLDLAMQIHNAANGLLTGKGANALQDVRKLALTAGNLVGADPNLKLTDNASKFEQLKFASQQLVAVASHNLSPRVAMNIYNQISAVKPGDQTSMQGLRDIISHQIIPALQRDKAIYGGVTRYYQNNPFRNDAMTVVPGQTPLENFSVKDVHKAQPGDFYIDPHTGNLRMRPLQ